MSVMYIRNEQTGEFEPVPSLVGPQGPPGTNGDGAGTVTSVNKVAPDTTGNVTLTAANVGARPDTWTPTASDVGALPSDGKAADADKLNGKSADYYATADAVNQLSQQFGDVASTHVVVEGVYINGSTSRLARETGTARVICVEAKPNTTYTVIKHSATIVRAGCGESADLGSGAKLVNLVQHTSASDAPLTVKTTGKYMHIYIQLFADSDSADLRSIEANVKTLMICEEALSEADELRNVVNSRVRYDVGTNLFDEREAIYGCYFDQGAATAGGFKNKSNTFAAYVRITGTGAYRMAGCWGLYGSVLTNINVFDKDKKHLGYIVGEYDEEREVVTIHVDDDRVCYIGYSNYHAQIGRTAMVVKGIEYPYAFVPFEGGYDVLNGIKVNADDVIGIETYPGHVQTAWEQRMLERIKLALIPVKALRKMAKAPDGYIGEGETLRGIVYSSRWESGDPVGIVGTRVPLSTYYSALENPASVMYTQDDYQEDGTRSTYYGITCSSFAAYAYGWDAPLSTEGLLNKYGDKLLDVSTENDLFGIKRGDLLINAADDDAGDHTKLVKDVVYYRDTGMLAGFNVAESSKPYVCVTFMTPTEFLAQMNEEKPYKVARPPEEDILLVVPTIKYSKSVYPCRGDGGKYATGETVQLYIPDVTATSITYSKAGASTTVALADLASSVVNGVTVYDLTGLTAGTYTIATDTAADDPCTVIIN